MRNVLVVSQIAMSLVLLCAAGLFLRSLQSAARIDVGFRSHGMIMMAVDPRLHGYTAERTAQFLARLRQRVAALPGVTSVAWTDMVPLSMGGRRDGFHVDGKTNIPDQDLTVDLFMATPGYFDTLGIPRVAGRDFGDEKDNGPKMAVVNEAFAQKLFGNEGAVGQRVKGGGVTYQIVGVVKNTKSRTLGEGVRPVLYRSLEQSLDQDPSFMGYSLVVRSTGDSARAVRNEISALDPTMAVFNVETIEEHLRNAMFLPRLAGSLFGIFGITGLVLAAVGLYGVMNYSVSRRTREIGIRMALGAPAGGVRRLIVRQGMALTGIGMVVGLGAAWVAAKLSVSILYGVQAHDLVTFIAVPLFLASVALLACWIPARRAARVSPLVALRYE
jgi:predicted permease